MSQEERDERERELARQRKARQREREREEQAQSVTVTSRDRDSRDELPVTPHVTPEPEHVTFRLKNLFSGGQKEEQPRPEEKILSAKEAEDAHEKLVFLYVQGSKILDDVLEIVVKGHEPVKIWELDDDEASMLAHTQLELAKKDKEAARVVRVLIRLHSRLVLALLVWPRAKATEAHIREHGGLSFR